MQMNGVFSEWFHKIGIKMQRVTFLIQFQLESRKQITFSKALEVFYYASRCLLR